jgi:hypothetical protein
LNSEDEDSIMIEDMPAGKKSVKMIEIEENSIIEPTEMI